MAVVLSGNDTVTLDGQLLSDFADGAIAMLEFQNELASTKTGKNGNTIVGENKMGEIGILTLRLLRGSADDKQRNTRLTQQLNNFSGFVMVQGTLTKFLGDGRGNVTKDSYTLSDGVYINPVNGESNVEGSTDQSVAIYKIRFSKARRSLG